MLICMGNSYIYKPNQALTFHSKKQLGKKKNIDSNNQWHSHCYLVTVWVREESDQAFVDVHFGKP